MFWSTLSRISLPVSNARRLAALQGSLSATSEVSRALQAYRNLCVAATEACTAEVARLDVRPARVRTQKLFPLTLWRLLRPFLAMRKDLSLERAETAFWRTSRREENSELQSLGFTFSLTLAVGVRQLRVGVR